jgi:TetR/AcrR family transcriptional regulator, cholesterol catabolism regulator
MEQPTDFKSMGKSLRKQRIIDVAVKVFHEKGYRSATLGDIAKELGVTKAALYHYVSSKEDLLSIIYIQALESFFANAYEIGEMDLPPPEKLRLLIRHHIKNIIIQNLAMFAVFFSEENQLPEKDFQKIRKEKRKYTGVVEGIIKAGIKNGYFRPTDPRLQAYAIIGMCNWLYKWYKPDESSQTPDEIADHFIALLENGYLRGQDQPGRNEGSESMARKRGLFEELRAQSKALTGLIEELEKFV